MQEQSEQTDAKTYVPNEDKPIFKRVLSQLRSELGGMYSLKRVSYYDATLVARTPFTLGMVIANIYSNFIQKGVGWDRMTIDIQTLTVCIKIPQNNECGALKVTMK